MKSFVCADALRLGAGDYLIVQAADQPSESGGTGFSSRADVVHILFPDQVAHLRTLPCWPKQFAKTDSASGSGSVVPDDMLQPESSDSDSDADPIICNPNRRQVEESESSEEESEEG